MSPLVLLVGTSLLLLPIACGGTVVFEEDGGGAGGSNPSTSVASSQTAVGTTSGPSASAATAGGSGPTATAVSVGQGGASDILLTITGTGLYGNCKPEVGPDPIGGSVAVAYYNAGSASGSLDGLRGTLTFATQVEGWVFPLSFDPSSSPVLSPGDEVEVEHLKVATDGDSSFVCQLCSMPATLALTWVDDVGSEVTAFADFRLACAL